MSSPKKPLNNKDWRTNPVFDPFRTKVSEKDDVVIDARFSRLPQTRIEKLPHNFFEFERHILFPRVVPYYSRPTGVSCQGKVRKENFIRVQLNIPSGLELRYQGRHWTQNTYVEVDFTFQQAAQLVQEFSKLLRRYDQWP